MLDEFVSNTNELPINVKSISAWYEISFYCRVFLFLFFSVFFGKYPLQCIGPFIQLLQLLSSISFRWIFPFRLVGILVEMKKKGKREGRRLCTVFQEVFLHNCRLFCLTAKGDYRMHSLEQILFEFWQHVNDFFLSLEVTIFFQNFYNKQT